MAQDKNKGADMKNFEKGLSKLEQELRIDEEKLPASYFDLTQKQKNELMFWAVASMNCYINVIRNAEMIDKVDYNLKMMLNIALGLTGAEKSYLSNSENTGIREQVEARVKQELQDYYDANKNCIKGRGYDS